MNEETNQKGVYLRPEKGLWDKIDDERTKVLNGVVLSKNDFIIYVLNKYFENK